MTVLWWTLRYEALMAARRKVVWGAVLPLALLSVLLAATSPVVTGHSDPGARIGAAAVLVNTFCTLGVGLALADRLRRDVEGRGMPDLLAATPAGPLVRTVGSVAGPLLTALVPLVVPFLSYAALLSVTEGSATPLGAAAVSLAAAVLPAAVLVTAFSGLLGVLLPVAAARTLTVVLWLWACHFPPAFSPVPTATGTVLSPLGGYPLVAWVRAPEVWAAREGTGPLRPEAGAAAAALNVALVLAMAATCHLLGHFVIRIRRQGA
ncbi:hypothetical protein ACWD6I_08370 [Streptomyces sp. NPDC002454]